MGAPASVTITEVVLRDGLQDESATVGVPEVRLVVSASEGHSRTNAGRHDVASRQWLARSARARIGAGSP